MTVELRAAPHVGWRALAATVLIISTATAAHTWAGGGLPAWPSLLLLSAAVFGGGLLVLRGRVSRLHVLAGVAVAQGCLHGMFGLLGHAHAHHGMAETMAGSAPFTWQMVAAHAVVTGVAALVWSLCERAVDVLLTVSAARLTTLAHRPRTTGPGRDAGLVQLLPGLVSTLHRGPPTAHPAS